MKSYEEWPQIMTADNIMECLELSRSDAYAILTRGPVIDPSKKRDRKISRGSLKKYLQEE